MAIFFFARRAPKLRYYGDVIYTPILLEISRRTRWWCLKCVIVYLARDIRPFVMYCVNGKPRSSLLIESTDSMISLVREAFKIRGAKYIIVDMHGNGHWSLEFALSTACVSVSESKLVEWTEYLIDNVYIKVGNNVYRQTIGIPMGTNCEPQLANLFLFHYKYLYMKNLMRDNTYFSKLLRLKFLTHYILLTYFSKLLRLSILMHYTLITYFSKPVEA